MTIVCLNAFCDEEKAVCIENRQKQRIFITKEKVVNAIIPSVNKETDSIKKNAWRCYHTDLSSKAVAPPNGLHAHKTPIPYMYIFKDAESDDLCFSYDGTMVGQLTQKAVLDVDLRFSGNSVTATSRHRLTKPFHPPLDNRCTLL